MITLFSELLSLYCLLVTTFFVHPFAVAKHKCYQPSQGNSNEVPQTKRGDGHAHFMLSPSENSLGPVLTLFGTLNLNLLSSFRSLPPKPKDQFWCLVTERMHCPFVVATDIHICTKEIDEFPPNFPKERR